MPAGTPFQDSKRADSLLGPLERRLANHLVLLVPNRLHSHHLTLLTLLWSVLMVGATVLAATNRRWMLMAAGLIVVQYLTDAVDGKIGKARGTMLVGWGYYMDHLLDYVFLCTILVGYALLLPASLHLLMMVALAIASGFMVSAFLARAVTGTLTISFMKVGPLGMRLIFAAIDVWIATVGQPSMLAAVPWAIGIGCLVLILMIVDTQRTLWRLDRSQAVQASPEV